MRQLRRYIPPERFVDRPDAARRCAFSQAAAAAEPGFGSAALRASSASSAAMRALERRASSRPVLVLMLAFSPSTRSRYTPFAMPFLVPTQTHAQTHGVSSHNEWSEAESARTVKGWALPTWCCARGLACAAAHCAP